MHISVIGKALCRSYYFLISTTTATSITTVAVATSTSRVLKVEVTKKKEEEVRYARSAYVSRLWRRKESKEMRSMVVCTSL